ncbi:hypothetical protein QBC38DRAFT_511481 [Podospora fimiseda]|uniref:Rhodopsin domain-containing protein n=1 Tax=Podospora fimiseda TaxID=252190 RepID=A0AAN7BK90_9PEZI|nr:hypothetical protein QBC38DRAFT_511481 [Podospora fimiseda]
MATAEQFAPPPPLYPQTNDDRGPQLLHVSWGLTVLASVFIILRLTCKRINQRRTLWWDDYILIACWAVIIANDVVLTILVTEFKLGRHSWEMEIADHKKFWVTIGARGSLIITAIVWAKTSFAVTLLRLTEGPTKHLLWFLIITMNIAMGGSAIAPWIQCTPVKASWDKTIEAKCWPLDALNKLWMATGGYSAAIDFTLAVIPWTFLYGMSLKKTEKWGILIAMSMSVIAGVVAIVKCIKLPALLGGDLYDGVEAMIWDVTEATVTMTACCIPALRVLVRDVKKAGDSENPYNEQAGISLPTIHVSRRMSRASRSGYIPTR